MPPHFVWSISSCFDLLNSIITSVGAIALWRFYFSHRENKNYITISFVGSFALAYTWLACAYLIFASTIIFFGEYTTVQWLSFVVSNFFILSGAGKVMASAVAMGSHCQSNQRVERTLWLYILSWNLVVTIIGLAFPAHVVINEIGLVRWFIQQPVALTLGITYTGYLLAIIVFYIQAARQAHLGSKQYYRSVTMIIACADLLFANIIYFTAQSVTQFFIAQCSLFLGFTLAVLAVLPKKITNNKAG